MPRMSESRRLMDPRSKSESSGSWSDASTLCTFTASAVNHRTKPAVKPWLAPAITVKFECDGAETRGGACNLPHPLW